MAEKNKKSLLKGFMKIVPIEERNRRISEGLKLSWARRKQMINIINTKYGDFKIIRKDAIAITIVKTKRQIRHHRRMIAKDELTHIEHRKLPRSFSGVKNTCGGWATPLITYNINGTIINLNYDNETNL